jgi:hypothetical protein
MPSGGILKMIEEISLNEPVERLQDGFKAYDECSQISKDKHSSPLIVRKQKWLRT